MLAEASREPSVERSHRLAEDPALWERLMPGWMMIWCWSSFTHRVSWTGCARVRTGARKWQVLSVSVDGVEEKCEAAVTRLEAVLTTATATAAGALRGDDGRKNFQGQ